MLGEREVLCSPASIPGKPPLKLQLLVDSSLSCADNLKSAAPGKLHLVCGEPFLDGSGNGLRVYLRSICNAQEDQFLNEITVTGRAGGKISETAQSASTSIAMPRIDHGKEETHWFKIRGFGHNRERLKQLPKGALVSVNGVFEPRTSQKGDEYCEIKIRSITAHAKAGNYNAAEGTSAGGYANSDFQGEPGELQFASENWDVGD